MTTPDAVEFVIVDVETTGLSFRGGDRIIEVAALKLKGGDETGRFESLVNPVRPVSYGAFLVNRISADILRDAPAASDVLPRLHGFLQGCWIVGHHVRFDLGFLRHEWAPLGLALENVPGLDTCKMARGLLPELGRYSLGAVAYALGVEEFQRHRAMADVEITAAVFRRLLDIAERRDLLDLPALAGSFGIGGAKEPCNGKAVKNYGI